MGNKVPKGYMEGIFSLKDEDLITHLLPMGSFAPKVITDENFVLPYRRGI